MLGLRLIVDGLDGEEPIYVNESVKSPEEAYQKAGSYIGKDCTITVYDLKKRETVLIIQGVKRKNSVTGELETAG